MKWTIEAEKAIKKVPFFVRKKVSARIEKEAKETGKNRITLAEVRTAKAKYLSNMTSEIKGYQIDICFGPGGCPNRSNQGDLLLPKIEVLFEKEDLLGFLKQSVKGDLKFHHEFRVTLADCPNACSQPQIKDIGIIGAITPLRTDEICTKCEACVEVCKEHAITLDSKRDIPEIDFNRCLKCRQCVDVCPTGTIISGTKGYRVQLGGKLGRHPKLAKELPGIFTEQEVLNIVKDCIIFYKKKSRHGERFAEIFRDEDFDEFLKQGVH
jgi:anaerobic sulfite reductase subunit C